MRELLAFAEAMSAATAFYVVPDDWSIAAVTVTQDQMAMLRLSLGALLRKVRREMGITRGDGAKRPKLPKGVLWVGELAVEGGVVKFFYVVRAARGEGARRHRARGREGAGSGARWCSCRRDARSERGYVELELAVAEQLGAAGWGGKMREAVKALGLEEQVPAELLVARRGCGSSWTRGGSGWCWMGWCSITCPRADTGCSSRWRSEAAGGAPVPSKVTDKAISGARASDGATRERRVPNARVDREELRGGGQEVPRMCGKRGSCASRAGRAGC